MKRTTRTGSRVLRISFLIFFSLLTVSCATGGGHKDVQKIKKLLQAEIDQFNGDIRWQDYEAAKAFVSKAGIQRYWAQTDRIKRDIRLTDFEVRDVGFSDDNRSARVLLHYQYWSLASPILKTANITQTWRYEELKKVWKVSDTGLGAIIRASSQD